MALFISRIGADPGGRSPDRGQHGFADVHAAARDRQCHQHAGRTTHRRRGAGRGAPLRSPGMLIGMIAADGGRRGLPAARADRRHLHADPVIVAAACRCWRGSPSSTSPTRRRPSRLRAARLPDRQPAAPRQCVALWGVGLGGGYLVRLRRGRRVRPGCAARRASGRRRRSALSVAALALRGLLVRRIERREADPSRRPDAPRERRRGRSALRQRRSSITKQLPPPAALRSARCRRGARRSA